MSEKATLLDDSNVKLEFSKYGAADVDAKAINEDRYFNDGVRLIDFVLAYQPNVMKWDKVYSHLTNEEKKRLFMRCRDVFRKKLKRFGLQLENEGIETSQDGKTCFLKVHAPFHVLATVAELNNMKLPVKLVEDQHEKKGIIEKLFKKNPFKLNPPWKYVEQQYYTAPFRKSRVKDFLKDGHDESSVFSSAQRIRLTYELIEKIMIEPRDLKKKDIPTMVDYPVGIQWLVQHGIFAAAYPLHDGEAKKTGLTPSEMPEREWLFTTWANAHHWYKYQPLDKIKNYFGEEVGLYFAWIGFLTSSLWFPTILGVITFLYGVISLQFDEPTKEICNHHSYVSNQTLCRQCNSLFCPFLKLAASCMNSRVSYVMDNFATPIFAFLIAIWSAWFLEGWKRKQAILQYRWDLTDLSIEAAKPLRPEYCQYAKEKRTNPITGQIEPYIKEEVRKRNFSMSIVSVAMLIVVVLGAVAGICFYKVVAGSIFYKTHNAFVMTVSPSLMGSISSSIINAVIILILAKVYTAIAWWLTEKEMPRTEDDFQKSYTYKMFVFQFVNLYARLFYIAFLEDMIEVTPLKSPPFGDRGAPGSRFSDLCMQLASCLILKLLLTNFNEIVIPRLKIWWNKRKNVAATEDNPYSRWEQDFDLPAPPRLALFDEYFEIVLQFGLVTFFVSAFPLAPLLVLINCFAQIRVDASKFVSAYRRPIPYRAADIGSWMNLLSFMSRLAVLINGVIIAFSSDFIERAVYSFYNHNSLKGFTLHMQMSRFDTDDWNSPVLAGNVQKCYYMGIFTSPDSDLPYVRRELWWIVTLARVIFLVLFENVVMCLQILMDHIIPDIPEEIQTKIQREEFMARQAMYQQQFPDTSAHPHPQQQQHSSKAGSMIHGRTRSELSDRPASVSSDFHETDSIPEENGEERPTAPPRRGATNSLPRHNRDRGQDRDSAIIEDPENARI